MLYSPEHLACEPNLIVVELLGTFLVCNYFPLVYNQITVKSHFSQVNSLTRTA